MGPGRPRESLSIEVKMTDRCNQACRHCVNADGPGPGLDLDWNAFLRRLEEWGKDRATSVCRLKEVRLTGGEPLLALEGVAAIAESCRGLGIRSGINTNGLLLDQGRIRNLKQSGLEIVKISLDTMDAAAYSRLRGPLPSFRKLLGTIEELVREDFKVILRFTLMRENVGYLNPCARLAGELGVYKFQVKPLIRSGRALDPLSFLEPGEIEGAIRGLAGDGAAVRPPVEILCWPPVAGAAFKYKHCGSIDKIYVSSDLGVSICNFIEGHQSAPIGSLAGDPLETIFRDRLDGTRARMFDGFGVIHGCPNIPRFEQAGI